MIQSKADAGIGFPVAVGWAHDVLEDANTESSVGVSVIRFDGNSEFAVVFSLAIVCADEACGNRTTKGTASRKREDEFRGVSGLKLLLPINFMGISSL